MIDAKLKFEMSVVIKNCQHEGDDVTLRSGIVGLTKNRWRINMLATLNVSGTSMGFWILMRVIKCVNKIVE